MWQLLLGFGIGVYVGTYFNCKPVIDNIVGNIKKNIPESKN
jgi:hypothetical protein